MGEDTWIRLYCSSPDLRSQFELRFRFVGEEWELVIDPMGLPAGIAGGVVTDPFTAFLVPLFSTIQRVEILPAIDAA